MIGQLNHEEFTSNYPNADIYMREGRLYAITKYGKSTYNYWVQHNDDSWTNYKCHTN